MTYIPNMYSTPYARLPLFFYFQKRRELMRNESAVASQQIKGEAKCSLAAWNNSRHPWHMAHHRLARFFAPPFSHFIRPHPHVIAATSKRCNLVSRTPPPQHTPAKKLKKKKKRAETFCKGYGCRDLRVPSQLDRFFINTVAFHLAHVVCA